jgi:hypothetical protein
MWQTAGGWLVMTLKFFGFGRDRSRALGMLDDFFQVRGVDRGPLL